MQGRGSIHKDQHGTTWIDDSYNANPDSVRSSIEAFMKKFPDTSRSLLLVISLKAKMNLFVSFSPN